MTKRPRDGRTADTGPNTSRPSKKSSAPDDLSLWHYAARSITPLKKAKARVPEVGAAVDAAPKAAAPAARIPSPKTQAQQHVSKSPPPPPPAAPRTPLPKAPPPLVPIERRKHRRIARGHVEIDARLDLHGLRQADAERRLRTFLLRARADGLRTVLVITGKGSERDSDEHHATMERSARGVLRRSVPLWLEAPELRDCVVGIAPAHVRHGGSGALYIHLRKIRAR